MLACTRCARMWWALRTFTSSVQHQRSVGRRAAKPEHAHASLPCHPGWLQHIAGHVSLCESLRSFRKAFTSRRNRAPSVTERLSQSQWHGLLPAPARFWNACPFSKKRSYTQGELPSCTCSRQPGCPSCLRAAIRRLAHGAATAAACAASSMPCTSRIRSVVRGCRQWGRGCCLSASAGRRGAGRLN